MGYRPLDSSVHGISQARILEWVAMPSSRRSSWSRGRTHISCVACISRWILYCWATRYTYSWYTYTNEEWYTCVWMCASVDVFISYYFLIIFQMIHIPKFDKTKWNYLFHLASFSYLYPYNPLKFSPQNLTGFIRFLFVSPGFPYSNLILTFCFQKW